MHDLETFSLSDMVACGMSIRQLAEDCDTLEEAANRFVDFIYENFRDGETGERNCVLVRFFQTVPYRDLDPELKAFARGVMGNPEFVKDDTRRLTLLATRGDEAAWNSRFTSMEHRAIPLPSPEIVRQFPMIAQLISQFGIEIESLFRRDQAMFLESMGSNYNVFHVPQARGSEVIPAQAEFIERYGVESVLGFGGLLPDGELFAFILFSRAPVSRDTADAFSTVSLSAKLAVLPFIERGAVFES